MSNAHPPVVIRSWRRGQGDDREAKSKVTLPCGHRIDTRNVGVRKGDVACGKCKKRERARARDIAAAAERRAAKARAQRPMELAHLFVGAPGYVTFSFRDAPPVERG